MQVNVRLSEEDFALIKKAAAKLAERGIEQFGNFAQGLAKLAANRTLVTPKKQAHD